MIFFKILPKPMPVHEYSADPTALTRNYFVMKKYLA